MISLDALRSFNTTGDECDLWLALLCLSPCCRSDTCRWVPLCLWLTPPCQLPPSNTSFKTNSWHPKRMSGQLDYWPVSRGKEDPIWFEIWLMAQWRELWLQLGDGSVKWRHRGPPADEIQPQSTREINIFLLAFSPDLEWLITKWNKAYIATVLATDLYIICTDYLSNVFQMA